jgi:hypothetical protein
MYSKPVMTGIAMLALGLAGCGQLGAADLLSRRETCLPSRASKRRALVSVKKRLI